jgi:hypothetical protein
MVGYGGLEEAVASKKRKNKVSRKRTKLEKRRRKLEKKLRKVEELLKKVLESSKTPTADARKAKRRGKVAAARSAPK